MVRSVEDLFDFFGQYNFTIDENDPNDHEVGIDPEMLGHIFENLLEDNKDKGAFYTPKVIVQYMCQESLIEYLATKLNSVTSLNCCNHCYTADETVSVAVPSQAISDEIYIYESLPLSLSFSLPLPLSLALSLSFSITIFISLPYH